MRELKLMVSWHPKGGVQVVGRNCDRKKSMFIHRVSVTGKNSEGKSIQVTFFYPKIFILPGADISLVDHAAWPDGISEVSAAADYFVVNRRAYSEPLAI